MIYSSVIGPNPTTTPLRGTPSFTVSGTYKPLEVFLSDSLGETITTRFSVGDPTNDTEIFSATCFEG